MMDVSDWIIKKLLKFTFSICDMFGLNWDINKNKGHFINNLKPANSSSKFKADVKSSDPQNLSLLTSQSLNTLMYRR